MGIEGHPFVERIRAERAIVTAVNRCRGVLGVELAGTSEKAVARWHDRIPEGLRCRAEVRMLLLRLNEAGRGMRLASSGSHRGAMVAEWIRRDASADAVESVEQAVSLVLRVESKSVGSE